MIEITQEMLNRIHTDSDIYDLAQELGVSFRELDYAIANKCAEGTTCHNCKYVSLSNCGVYPCNDCIRKHRTDYYEHIDIKKAYTIDDLAQALDKTKKQTLSYMLQQCKDIDYQCIPDNGFKYKKEVDAWWKERKNDESLLFGIFDEYYGVGDTIKMLNEDQPIRDEYNNDFCEWKPDKEFNWFIKSPHEGVGIIKEESSMFKFCPSCGKKIKVVR